MRIWIAATAVGLLMPVLAAAQPADTPIRLAPHRAIYDLSLVGSTGSRTVESARGRIAFDFGGDACDGYTLKYRQVTVIESGETGARTLDVRTATFESGDGKTLRFKTDSQLEGMSDDNVDGEAEIRPDGSLGVRLSQPKRDNFDAAGNVVFPTAQMKLLIDAARRGEKTVSVKLYDGSDDGRKVYDTLAVIGRRIDPKPDEAVEAAARHAELAKLPRWPMTVSYFTAGSGEQTPVYTLSFELYENGVSRALKLDYGDFALKGDLQSLDMLPPGSCQR